MVWARCRDIQFLDRAPHRSNQELAERTAADVTDGLNSGFISAQNKWKEVDDKYKIAEKTKEQATKAKNAIWGLFKKKLAEEPPTTTDQ